MIDPKQYPKLATGAVYVFEQFNKKRKGKLLFCQNHKKDVLDKEGKVIQGKSKIVSHRCAFEPVEEEDLYHTWHTGEKLKVHAIHMEAGTFAIGKY